MVKNGKTILSGINPAGRADKIVDSLQIKNRTLYFCPSPLYGYGLTQLLSRLENEAHGSAVLCIEIDPEFFNLSAENIDASITENKKFHLTNIFDIEKLFAVIRGKWGVMAFRRIEMIRLNGGWQLFAKEYDSITEQLRSEIALQWSNALTLNKLGRLFIRNLFRNLPLLADFQSIEKLSYGSSPVLVLGAGPSLDEVLEQIIIKREPGTKNNEQRAARCYKIICVDTCLGALKERGVIPDLVVILESQHWNLRDFIGCKGWEVNAAIDLSSLPSSALLLSGGGFLFFTEWTNLRVFKRLKEAGLLPFFMPPLGSVGLTAVEIARNLTTGKIICAGLDFSFTQDKYHARSTPGHRSKLNSHNRFRGLMNIASYDSYSTAAASKSGESVYTSPSMKNYRNLFESYFSGDSRIYDIEGSGLSLGVKTLSMNEAISILNEKNLNSESTQTSTNNCRDIEEKVREAHGKRNDIILFYKSERKRLEELKDILTGEKKADKERLSVLLNECDYLWAHFPDYSGGRECDTADLSFLKRVRAEIDPMLKLLTVHCPLTAN